MDFKRRLTEIQHQREGGWKRLFGRFAYPGSYALARALLEGQAEGAVAAITTFAGQLLDGEGQLGTGYLLVAADEVVDAQIINIGIVSDALTGEIMAEIAAVGAKGLSQLL